MEATASFLMYILRTTDTHLVQRIAYKWYNETEWPSMDYYYGHFNNSLFHVTCFLPCLWFKYHGYHYKVYKTKAAAQGVITRLANRHIQAIDDLNIFPSVIIEEI